MMSIQTTHKIRDNQIIGLEHTILIKIPRPKHHHRRHKKLDNNTTFRVSKRLNRITGLNKADGTTIYFYYKPKHCKWCKNLFIPKHSNQRYCCEQCRGYGDQYHTMIRVRRYRKKYQQVLRERLTSNRIGTGKLGAHACREFKEEFNKIRKEMRTLGLNTVFSY